MALDVYVGTMTRYYRREWENDAERYARERGIRYERVSPAPESAPPPAENMRRFVLSWCDGLSSSLSEHGVGPVAWDESDKQPYFSDRPGWDGYCALLLWAAHAEHPELPVPEELPESWTEDEAFQRSSSPEFKSRFRNIYLPMLWLPVELPFVFQAPTVASEEPSWIGSTFALNKQVQNLADTTRASLESGGSPVAEAAKHGIGVFAELSRRACESQLPMLLDF